MANWCNNKVEFIGEHSQFEQLAILFQGMAAKEKKEKRGQLPPFVTDAGGGYFFETAWENGILYYQTKWAPNTAILVRFAEELRVGFTYSYDEIGNGVFGEATYFQGTLTEIDLDADDSGQYEYNSEDGTYRFENQNYGSSEDILAVMLQRKKAALKHKDLNPNE